MFYLLLSALGAATLEFRPPTPLPTLPPRYNALAWYVGLTLMSPMATATREFSVLKTMFSRGDGTRAR